MASGCGLHLLLWLIPFPRGCHFEKVAIAVMAVPIGFLLAWKSYSYFN
jgi:hypothetical protein